MWLGIISLWIGFLCLMIYIANSNEFSDKNLKHVEQGKMSIVNYQDHSYIVWSINLGGGICHNPECHCQKQK